MVVTDAAWGVLNIGFWEGFHPGELVYADLYESRNLDCGTHCYLISAAAAAHLAAAALPIDVQLDSGTRLRLPPSVSSTLSSSPCQATRSPVARQRERAFFPARGELGAAAESATCGFARFRRRGPFVHSQRTHAAVRPVGGG